LALLAIWARDGANRRFGLRGHASADRNTGPWGNSLVLLLVVAIVISAFMNNITVVVIFIPIIQALAVRFNQPASKLLIALNYAAVLGG